MQSYFVTVPESIEVRPEDASAVHEYLVGTGMLVGGVSTVQELGGRVIGLSIEASADPQPHLRNYVRQESQDDRARAVLAQAKAKLTADTDLTPAELRQVLRALIHLQGG